MRPHFVVTLVLLLLAAVAAARCSWSGEAPPAAIDTERPEQTPAPSMVQALGESGSETLREPIPSEALGGTDAVTLTGRVLDEQGQPAGGALVFAEVASWFGDGQVSPPPVRARDDGTFEMLAQPFAIYDLYAAEEGRNSHRRRVRVLASPPPPMQLIFAGAITMCGVVLDERGAPIARAGVQAWYEEQSATSACVDPSMQPAVWTDAQGRFSIDVSRYGRYRLIASADGHPHSPSVWAEPCEGGAHTESVLRLPAYATINGRVWGINGSPLAGAWVEAAAEADPASLSLDRTADQQFGSVCPVRTGSGGCFELRVPPGVTWAIVVSPRGSADWRRVRRGGIAPGASGLDICCREEEMTGCAVRVFVTRDDGGPADSLRVDFKRQGEPIDLASWPNPEKLPRFEEGAWVLPRLPWREQYVVTAWDKGDGTVSPLAPVTAAFTTDRPELTLHLRMSPIALVTVGFADADAARMRGVTVGLGNQPGLLWFFPRKPDLASLTATFRASPGAARLTVYDCFDVAIERDLWLVPGLNTDVVVHLPARSGKPR